MYPCRALIIQCVLTISWAQINVCILFFPSFLSLLDQCPWKSYTHLCQSITCLSQIAYAGSCVYEKPIQKQRCSCNSTQVAPTQWSNYAMLWEHQICQVSILLAAQFLQWWPQEAGQPEPACTFDAEDFSRTGFSKWKLSQESSGERLFDTRGRLPPASTCSLTGYFDSLPFS